MIIFLKETGITYIKMSQYNQISKKFIEFCKSGNILELNKIYQNKTISNEAKEEAFSIVCKNGQTNMIEWFITNLYSKDDSFNLICEYGYKDIFDWFVNKYKKEIVNSEIDIHNTYDYPFRLSCINDHLDITKELLELDAKLGIKDKDDSYKTIDINSCGDHVFRDACVHGNLEKAKWIMTLSDKINVNILLDEAFRFSCVNGHKHIAMFLLEINDKINIHAVNDFAFRHACRMGQYEVVEFLINYNNKITKGSLTKGGPQITEGSCSLNIHVDNDFALNWIKRNLNSKIESKQNKYNKLEKLLMDYDNKKIEFI